MRPAAERPERRVVITGMGALTPIGLSVPAFWEALLAGRSGAATIRSFDAEPFPTTFACELKAFDALDHMDRKLASRLDPYVQYALAATEEALADAGLGAEGLTSHERDRVGVVFGTGQGGIQTFQRETRAYLEGGPKRISPFSVPMMIPNMAAGTIAMRHGFRGPNHCVSSACATGNHALAQALLLLRSGEADVVVCGGAEAPICEVGIGGFSALRALSTRNDSPDTASRPFDATRDGFVLGEGAATLVLETLPHALARGARIYAELLAVGTSADAHHATAPHPEGAGALLAMERALARAGVTAAEVDSINLHATSTTLGDARESKAIRILFGARADEVVVTSTKSATGHLLGAAGTVEAIACVLSMRDSVVPPTINFRTPDPECDLPCAFNAPVARPVRVTLSNAFGFGGHNTSAAFRSWS